MNFYQDGDTSMTNQHTNYQDCGVLPNEDVVENNHAFKFNVAMQQPGIANQQFNSSFHNNNVIQNNEVNVHNNSVDFPNLYITLPPFLDGFKLWFFDVKNSYKYHKSDISESEKMEVLRKVWEVMPERKKIAYNEQAIMLNNESQYRSNVSFPFGKPPIQNNSGSSDNVFKQPEPRNPQFQQSTTGVPRGVRQLFQQSQTSHVRPTQTPSGVTMQHLPEFKFPRCRTLNRTGHQTNRQITSNYPTPLPDNCPLTPSIPNNIINPFQLPSCRLSSNTYPSNTLILGTPSNTLLPINPPFQSQFINRPIAQYPLNMFINPNMQSSTVPYLPQPRTNMQFSNVYRQFIHEGNIQPEIPYNLIPMSYTPGVNIPEESNTENELS